MHRAWPHHSITAHMFSLFSFSWGHLFTMVIKSVNTAESQTCLDQLPFFLEVSFFPKILKLSLIML